MRRREVAVVIAFALGLSACGGGGGGNGNVRPVQDNPPSTAPPTTPPPTTPPPSTEQPPLDAHLALTHAYSAHDEGFIGQGVTIGVVDSGIMRAHPALAGRVDKELVYVDPASNNTKIDDVVGHGTWVSEIAAGKAFDRFPGGIAPGARLVSARIVSDKSPTDDGSGRGNRVDSADPLGAINDDLIANGVKVMNNSWGGLYWDASATATTKSFHDAYDRYVNQWGGLVVFATGNESMADPSDTAALPTRAPDLEKGWLAVAALDSNHPIRLERPPQLASYSNACGVAMHYCLVAPGDVVVSGKDDTASKTGYWVVRGTSFAAPQVSGAAALVWQAFPYFSNDLVRQTLLGTATDIGAPGPDEIFGYGLLNIRSAVEGPAKFDWGDVTVNLAGTSTWSNVISGTGGLIKQGPGTLNVWQHNSYTGLTQVQGGTLAVVGLNSPVQIGPQGTLASVSAPLNPTSFSINNNLTNAGVVVVDGPFPSVLGDYLQQGNGRLAVSLGSALIVSGKAILSGGDLYVFGANTDYTVNSHTRVLSAYGGLSGTFSALTTAPGVALTATLNYDATEAWLDVQQVNLAAIRGLPYTAASYGAAQRTQNAFVQINGQIQGGADSASVGTGFVSAAANLQHTASMQAMQRSLESLSGQLHAASAAMAFEAIDASTRALSDRFDRLLDAPQAGGWTQDLGYHGGMARGGYSPVGVDLSGLLVGNDYRLAGNAIAGYAISQSQGLGRLAESADQGRSRALEGMLYGGVIHGSGYLMGRFGVGNYRETMRRSLQLGSQFAGVGSDSRGRYGVAYGESGYRLGLAGLDLTPYVNLQYSRLQNDGFNELGAGGFGLKAGARSIDRWQAGVGLRAGRHWALAHGGSLSLQARVLWQQAFAVHGEVAEASFTGIDQWAPLGGIGLSRYGGMAGATVNWQVSPTAGVQLGYDQRFGQREQARMATLNYRWSF